MDDKTQQMLNTIASMEEEIARLRNEMSSEQKDAQPQENADQGSPSQEQPSQPPQPSEPQKQVEKPIQATTDEGTETEEEPESIPLVGRQGYFDGVFMIGDIEDKKFQVPPNYVSKSLLVVGDRMEIVDVDDTGSKYFFKQLDHVERKEVQGILTKKDNQWAVLLPDNKTYYVVAAAVKYYGGEIGDKAVVILPDQEVPVENVEWAALKELHKATGELKGPAHESASEAPQEKPPQQPVTTPKTTVPQQQQPTQPKQAPSEPANQPQASPAEKTQPEKQQAPATPAESQSTQPAQTPAFDQQIPIQQSASENQPQQASQPSGEAKQGEVVISNNQGDDNETSIGEVDLTEEQLWELR